ncbi:T9SS type B sorting domain-containing protein [Taibaiella lutea]|uniref:T9SS type B sorting domain-containing protein n=1 Tax=Taibaiella lutea TaxID=2608001 RepID=A0A5M6CBI5_9BACT|nr:gliding motility-associated C-terminal domain-containing protein [Taibaiella lutea]KAA5532343.1 T9SS type B sorting domain-containing protein [Taibaiella lutea]
MKHFILLFFIACSFCAFSQNDDKVWVFGTHAGINFNTTPPSAITTAITGYEGTASICDENGQLLFYTQGIDIWDRNHQIMPNGAGIMPVLGGTPTTTQQAAIVKMPGSDSKYYVFSLRDGNVEDAKLYYSIVDMSLNSGFGDVIPSQKTILVDSYMTEKMTVAAGNNCDAWLMLRSAYMQYKAFHITAAGLNPVPVISAVGSGSAGNYIYGYLVISPDRTKMAAAVQTAFELYDFDATTGLVSNPRFVPSTTSPYPDSYYGLSFSPDNTKLYTASIGNGIKQFDITQPTITAIQNSVVSVSSMMAAAIRIAPDGKIYIPHLASDIVSSIDYPNLAGAACQFNANALQLDSIDVYGLPNYNVSFRRDSISNRYIRHLCADSVVLSPFNSGIDYVWNNGSTSSSRTVAQPGTYVLRYHYLCSYFTDTFLILPKPLFPQLSLLKGNCDGQQNGSIAFSQQAGDTTTYHYSWSDAAGNLLTEYYGNAGFQLSAIMDGNYSLKIATTDGCDTVLQLNIPLLPAPHASFESGNLFCVGEPVVYTSTTTAPYTLLQWYFGDAGQETGATPEHIYNQSGTYEVMLVATNASCSDTATASIHIREFNLQLSADKDFPDFKENIQLQTSATEPYTVSAWFPESLFPQQQALSQALQADTTRTYIATGQSSTYHCTDTATITIPVKPLLHFPNAFSPNADGLNDFFAPVIWGSDIAIQRFAVYDRWGNKIWSANGSAALKGWDGHYSNGRLADMGTYYWYMEYTDALQKQSLKGDVILMK